MITGLELTLAILPLLISVADHHKKGLQPAKTILSTKAQNEEKLLFYAELYDELALLEHTLKWLLKGLPSRLETQGLSSLTQDEQDEIEGVLGSSAQHFGELLGRLLKSLNDLISERSLIFDTSDTSVLSSRTMLTKLQSFREGMKQGVAISTLRQRFRFTRNDNSRKVAISKIRQANRTLERLLQTSLLGQLHEKERRIPITVEKKRLRRMSEPLDRKFADKLATACDTHDSHEARLCLWNCCSLQRQKRSSDSLDLILSVTDVGDSGSHWQESIILISSPENEPASHSVVRFQVETREINTSAVQSLPRRNIESESLCRLIQEAHIDRGTLEIVFDQGEFWQTESKRKSLSIQKQRDVTLKEFLVATASHISLREKRILAVILAHAALHGSGSLWLSENWSKEHISFFRKDDSPTPDLRRPFLKVVIDRDDVASNRATNLCRANSSLESLGILLLEINSGTPIESKWHQEDLNEDGQPNAHTNLTAAVRLSKKLKYEVFEDYSAAVSACLDPNIGSTEGAEDFAKEMYRRIVLPLERELDHGFHLKPEQFGLVPVADPIAPNAVEV